VETDRNVTALHKALIEWMCSDSQAGGSRGLCCQLFSYRAQIFLCFPIYFFFRVPILPDSGSWTPLKGLRVHTQTRHTRQDFSGQVISPTQRPLSDNTQQAQEKDFRALPPVGIEPAFPASERSETARSLGSARCLILILNKNSCRNAVMSETASKLYSCLQCSAYGEELRGVKMTYCG